MTATAIGTQITITSELATAAAAIASRHSDCAIRIEYREESPENLWHVIAEGVERDTEYVVNDETGQVQGHNEIPAMHPTECDLDESCMCVAPKLTKSQRNLLERAVMNNGWVTVTGSAHQAMARKLEGYGYITRSDAGSHAYITEAGREVIR